LEVRILPGPQAVRELWSIRETREAELRRLYRLTSVRWTSSLATRSARRTRLMRSWRARTNANSCQCAGPSSR